MRPNIRVEIQNNLVEPMDVDENEEGELSDAEDKRIPEKEPPPNHSMSSKSVFISGIDVLGKNEQEKLQERARRFRLNPNEIKNFTDEDLKLLHNSLGINASNESNVRFEVIHMRGIEQMNAGDILDYFLEYAPVSVEWIDEESCNVVWLDRLSAARALHFMSKPVRGMPVRDDTSYFDNLQESEEVDQSILLVTRNREIQLLEEPDVPNKFLNDKNSVDISEITATIPPGYWRLGNKHPNSKCILLRYSLKKDKKHFKTEQFSRYYKTQGVKSKKVTVSSDEQQTSQGIFGRNKDMHRVHSNDNPWAVLAKNWDEDEQFREKERNSKVEESKIEIKNQSLKVRLGTKRKESDVDGEQEEKPKKVKIPRMRMYADEEEEKIKRKKMLKRINYQMKKIEEDTSNTSDLRTVLNMANRTHRVKSEPAEQEVFDLGTTLRNRNRKMVFEIKREKEDQHEEQTAERNSYRDRRTKEHMRKERESEKKHSHSDEDLDFRRDHKRDKPQSKVAVVIKTQKKPTVASAVAPTVWSRVSGISHQSESESESEVSSSADSSESEQENAKGHVKSSKLSSRPGFTVQEKISKQATYKRPLKIEINNDHFKRN